MLIVVPLGLLAVAVIFDILYFITGSTTLAAVALYDIAAGILGGLLAAVFGLRDWLAVPAGTRAKRIGLWHGGGNVLVLVLFALSWWLRRDTPEYAPTALAFGLALAGAGLSLVTGWLGGELIYRLRVSVDDGAYLDASSSLSGKPATLSDPNR
jgi:uncharacterized membrane protein